MTYTQIESIINTLCEKFGLAANQVGSLMPQVVRYKTTIHSVALLLFAVLLALCAVYMTRKLKAVRAKMDARYARDCERAKNSPYKETPLRSDYNYSLDYDDDLSEGPFVFASIGTAIGLVGAIVESISLLSWTLMPTVTFIRYIISFFQN